MPDLDDHTTPMASIEETLTPVAQQSSGPWPVTRGVVGLGRMGQAFAETLLLKRTARARQGVIDSTCNHTLLNVLVNFKFEDVSYSMTYSRQDGTTMPFAFAVLIGFQLVGEIVRQAFGLPLPGPLIGMFLLAVALTAQGRKRGRGAETALVATPSSPLVQTSNVLITYMGLLFVPAGVGVVAEMGLLRAQWLPILVGLVVSTLLGLAVTALVMHHVSRFVEARPPTARSRAARPREVL